MPDRDSNGNRLRVFHGISGAAGQPASIVAALRQEGIDAVNYVAGGNKYRFSADRRIPRDRNLHATLFSLLEGELRDFDIFHFYFRSLFYDSGDLSYPTGLDLILLRLFGKRIILNFRGSEVRIHSIFKRLSPFNYVDENPDELVTKFPEQAQRDYIQMASAACHHILVPDPELQSYVPNAQIVPRSIDLEIWKPTSPARRDRPLLVHAPSRRVVKGSDHIVRATSELKAEGLDFEFRLIEGMSNEDARTAYQKADVIVDQLRIGWYGVLAVEGMALQKAVVSYVRDDLIHHLGDEPPIAVANPNSVKEVLRKLITDVPYRNRIALAGRRYCEAVHDSRKVARQLASIYEREGAPIDEESLVGFFSSQFSKHVVQTNGFNSQIRELKRELSIAQRKLETAEGHLDYIRNKLAPFLWIRNRYRKLRLRRSSG